MDVEGSGGEAVGKVDEGLYSRQLYVLSHTDMLKISSARVLLLGLQGLGAEVAKNIILAGVKAVVLHDDEGVSLADLSSQCFLRESDVGQSRALASAGALAELNGYVAVSTHKGTITEDLLARFTVVVATNWPLQQRLWISDYCHSHGITFIATEARGVFANVFCDFGVEHTVFDANGEPPFSQMISAITQNGDVLEVTLTEDKRLQLETGEWVKFTEVRGLEYLNDGQPRQIKVLGPYSFSIAHNGHGEYFGGGHVTEVKQPKKMQFLSLRESLKAPTWTDCDFGKSAHLPQLHIAFQALATWQERNGQLPFPRHKGHAQEIINLSSEINAGLKLVETIDEGLLRTFAYGAMGVLAPMVSFIGGVVGQEVLKSCSGKFAPIFQWLYFDAIEVLPRCQPPSVVGEPEQDLDDNDFFPINSRYDGQIVTLGRDVQGKLAALNYFLVGAGAIGCEMLKLWALMGLGTDGGRIHVTDMDVIERSNLNRQFLFRSKDVGRTKAEVAAEAAKSINEALNINPYTLRVGAENESIFNDDFYEALSGVCNALDNIEARLYMDTQCIYYLKPMIDAGTLGTKGNTQVVVPRLTESYASSTDPPERTIPVCTLHHFPNKIEHTIHWARDLFEGLFKNQGEHVNAYLSHPEFVQTLSKQPGAQQMETLKAIQCCLVTERPLSFDDCIAWARLKFEEYFNNNIQQLLFNFPVDTITPSGAPFWSGPKRPPRPLTFNAADPLHLAFVTAAANLRAANFGLKGDSREVYLRERAEAVNVVPFSPRTGVQIATKDEEQKKLEEEASDHELVANLLRELPPPSSLAGYRMTPLNFEKDDDTNFHVDFITAASNLRARNYKISEADRHSTKGIAGKIIPALVTTTAAVAGLACLELLKLAQGRNKLEDYKNTFINLALPFFGFSEPIAPPRGTITAEWTWTLWDRFDVEGPLTLRELIKLFRERYRLNISMCSSGVTLLYSFFMPKAKLEERMNMEVSQVVAAVTRKPLPLHKKHLQLEVSCSRVDDGEDVEVPYVRYQFRQ